MNMKYVKGKLTGYSEFLTANQIYYLFILSITVKYINKLLTIVTKQNLESYVAWRFIWIES
jgi:hypothetical protein